MERVCIIGNLNVDIIMGPLSQTPEWGKEKVVRYSQLRVSGQVGYTALALANLGVEVSVIANVGDDFYGRFVLREMKKSNINIEGVKIVKNTSTGITVSLVNEKGERALVSYPGSMEYFTERDIKEKWQLIEKCGYVVFNGYFLLPGLNFDVTSRLFARLQNLGKTTILDTGWDPSDWPGRHIEEIKGLLKYTDIFLPNLDEAKVITGNRNPVEILNILASLGPSKVAVKMGQEGSVAIEDGKVCRQPSFKIKVTDTTGAGDVFNAGFLYGIMSSWDLEKTLKFATALASLYILSEGKVMSLSVEKVQSFLKSNI